MSILIWKSFLNILEDSQFESYEIWHFFPSSSLCKCSSGPLFSSLFTWDITERWIKKEEMAWRQDRNDWNWNFSEYDIKPLPFIPCLHLGGKLLYHRHLKCSDGSKHFQQVSFASSGNNFYIVTRAVTVVFVKLHALSIPIITITAFTLYCIIWAVQ